MAGIIDIEYGELKKAIAEIEKKRKICKILPSARFQWANERYVGNNLQVGNHCPSLESGEFNSGLSYNCIVCDRLGGKSTGAGMENCRNCQPLKKHPLYPESQAMKEWNYNGAKCFIVLHGSLGHYCGYVRFRKNPFTRGCHYDGFRNYIPVHGGITYAKKDSAGYVYGYDCAHAGDDENPELKNIDWLIRHTEKFADMLIVARDYEVKYNQLSSNKHRAKLLDEFREKVGPGDEGFNFGMAINLLSGEL